MAIKRKEIVETGVEADYWVITSYIENPLLKTSALVELSLYTNEDSLGFTPHKRVNYEIPLEVINTVNIEDSVEPYIVENFLINGEIIKSKE